MERYREPTQRKSGKRKHPDISPVDFNAESETTPLPITFAVAFTKDINLLARSLSHKYKGVSLADLLLFLVPLFANKPTSVKFLACGYTDHSTMPQPLSP